MPLQLAVIAARKFAAREDERHERLVLYDCDAGRILRSFPLELPDASAAAAFPVLATMTPDGSRVAAAVRHSEQRGVVVAWDAATGADLIRREAPAGALAIAPDATFVATGDDDGRISVWSLPEGERFAELRAGGNRITSLAFQRNPRRAELDDPQSVRDPWLIAAGDSGGTVTVWNPTAGVPVSFCRGAHHQVTAVEFSPDATLVAGGAHAEVRLWDVATGRLLLRIDPNESGTGKPLQWISGLAFSPDGTRLAITSLKRWSPPTVTVLQLENGRGIRTLRGLSGEPSKIRFSADDRFIAGFSHRWEIGGSSPWESTGRSGPPGRKSASTRLS
ncbi:MAG: hypothetical protein WD066_16905 [Planctomycetaceae bacterium]